MKIRHLLIMLFLLQNIAMAQNQQGYVKTLGRPDKKGQVLSGVTIRVKGQHNPVVSGKDGAFSITMNDMKNGDPYSLQQVKKNGYELNEPTLIGRQLAFSDKVPLTIVMASPDQIEADKTRIEEKAQQVAGKNYEARLALLEQQLSDNHLTQVQYQDSIRDLQAKFEKYQSLIEGMAEHYAHTDYDLLDQVNREINLCIENGQLERADSLIQTLFNPIEALRRNKEALEALDRQIAQAQDILSQADNDMAAVLKQQEKDAEYLYQLHTIAAAKFDFDRAQQYLDTRAELDPTNVIWQHEAALFAHRQNQLEKAEKYYLRALEGYRTLAEEVPEVYEEDLMYILTDLGYYYLDPERFDLAETYTQEALAMARQRAQDASEQSKLDVADVLLLLHIIYLSTDRVAESETVINEAFDIVKKIAKKHSKDPIVLDRYQSIMEQVGFTYYLNGRYAESEKYYTAALDLARKLVKIEPKYIINMPSILDHLIRLYTTNHQYAQRDQCIQEVLEIRRKQASDNPQAYEPDLAILLYDYGSDGIEESKFLDSSVNEEDVDQDLFYVSMDYLDEALVLFRKYAHLDYIPYWYTHCLNLLCEVFMMVNDHENCRIYMSELAPLYKAEYQKNPNGQQVVYADLLEYLAAICMVTGHPADAETYGKEALRVDPSRQDVYNTLAPAMLLQGKYAEAEKIYLQNKGEMKDSMLEDLELLKERNLIPEAAEKDVERLKQRLNE
jgi:tetratricopeptide (TPR) repeat protein